MLTHSPVTGGEHHARAVVQVKLYCNWRVGQGTQLKRYYWLPQCEEGSHPLCWYGVNAPSHVLNLCGAFPSS